MRYIYEGHLGSIYTTSYELDYDDLYCEQCGDSDYFVGEVETVGELLDTVANLVLGYCNFSPEYVQEWVNEEFPDLDIKLPTLPLTKTREYRIITNEHEPVYCEFFNGTCEYFDEEYNGPECGYCFENYEYELVQANKHLDMNTLVD